MTDDRPLGTLSDELNRVMAHFDKRAEELAKYTAERADELGRRTDAQFEQINQVLRGVNVRIDEHKSTTNAVAADIKQEIGQLTVQVRETNGRVRGLELWQAGVKGALAATGMNWKVLAGVVTTLVAISALAVSIAVAVMR